MSRRILWLIGIGIGCLVVGAARSRAQEKAPPPAPAEVAVAEVVVDNLAVEIEEGPGGPPEQQLRPQLNTEILFLASICKPTEAQKKEITKAGEKGLAKAAKQLMKNQQRQNQPIQVNFGRPQVQDKTSKEPTPLQLIQDALTEAAKAELTPAQSARYLRERELRDAEQTVTSILGLITWLDQALLFSPEQRETLEKNLSAHFDSAWLNSSEDMFQGNSYLPSIPDKLVTPLLTKAQKTVWNGTMKIVRLDNGGFMFQQAAAVQVEAEVAAPAAMVVAPVAPPAPAAPAAPAPPRAAPPAPAAEVKPAAEAKP